jgi:hypothetical protein
MTKYIYVVFSAPVQGREEEYHRWYESQHIPDVLTVPGFITAQRFELHEVDSTQPPYLAIYELETHDANAALSEAQRRAGTPAMVMSEAIDLNRMTATLYRARGPKRQV